MNNKENNVKTRRRKTGSKYNYTGFKHRTDQNHNCEQMLNIIRPRELKFVYRVIILSVC